jgi:hypothetical protein
MAPGFLRALSGPWLYAAEQRSESFRDGQMGYDGVAQLGVGELRQDGGLNCSHDFTGLRADHREAQYAVIRTADHDLHEALGFVGRFRAQYAAHRQFGDPNIESLACGVLLR